MPTRSDLLREIKPFVLQWISSASGGTSGGGGEVAEHTHTGYVWRDGSLPMLADWDAGPYTVQSDEVVVDILQAIGTSLVTGTSLAIQHVHDPSVGVDYGMQIWEDDSSNADKYGIRIRTIDNAQDTAFGLYIDDVTPVDASPVAAYAIYTNDGDVFHGDDVTLQEDDGYLTLEPASQASAGNTDVDSPYLRFRAREWDGAASQELEMTVRGWVEDWDTGQTKPGSGGIGFYFDGNWRFALGYNYNQTLGDPFFTMISSTTDQFTQGWSGTWLDVNLVNAADNTVFAIRNQDSTYKAGFVVEGKVLIGSPIATYPTTAAMLHVSTGYLGMDEQAAPSTPAAGTFAIYPKTDGKLYGKNDAGAEYDLTSSTGLPAGSSGQTLRHTGAAWAASSILQNDGSQVTVQNPDLLNPVILINTATEDTDSGRETGIAFQGYTAASTKHTLASILVEHQGSGADQFGRLRLYTNAGAGTTLKATLDKDGYFGLATGSPLMELHVAGQSGLGNNVTTNYSYINMQLDQTNSGNDQYRGFRSYLTQSAGGNSNNIIAVDGAVYYSAASGTLTGARGADYSVIVNDAGTITTAKAVSVNIASEGTNAGSIGTAILGDFTNYAFTHSVGTFTITTAYGIKAGVSTSGGGTATLTTGYGVYIDNVDASTAWGLYQADSAARNYFAGNVGLGAASFGSSAAKVLAIANGTAPASSPADMVQLYSADRGGTAGKAGLHVRSEDGTSHVLSDRTGIGTTTPATLFNVDGAALFGGTTDLTSTAVVGIKVSAADADLAMAITGTNTFRVGVNNADSGNCVIVTESKAISIKNGATGEAPLASGTRRVHIDSSGYVYTYAPASAPADANLDNAEIVMWLDETGNNLTFKVKYSGGTVKSGTVPLA